jgi:hypothetical protein
MPNELTMGLASTPPSMPGVIDASARAWSRSAVRGDARKQVVVRPHQPLQVSSGR